MHFLWGFFFVAFFTSHLCSLHASIDCILYVSRKPFFCTNVMGHWFWRQVSPSQLTSKPNHSLDISPTEWLGSPTFYLQGALLLQEQHNAQWWLHEELIMGQTLISHLIAALWQQSYVSMFLPCGRCKVALMGGELLSLGKTMHTAASARKMGWCSAYPNLPDPIRLGSPCLTV